MHFPKVTLGGDVLNSQLLLSLLLVFPQKTDQEGGKDLVTSISLGGWIPTSE